MEAPALNPIDAPAAALKISRKLLASLADAGNHQW